MKTLNQWFDEYAVSHQNKTNQLIHFVCVPVIYFSIIGLIMSIPAGIIENTLNLNLPVFENWAVIFLIFSLLFYLRLSFSMFLEVLVFSIICFYGNYYLGTITNLFYASLALFVIAWIGQFYGHKIEGAKPSFLQDLQFLLIGPAWVIKKVTSKK